MQSFIADAPFIVVVCSDKKEAELLYEERAERYVKHHVGAAIENFLLKITDLGLASCWIGAFSDNAIKDILEIPEDIHIEETCDIYGDVIKGLTISELEEILVRDPARKFVP